MKITGYAPTTKISMHHQRRAAIGRRIDFLRNFATKNRSFLHGDFLWHYICCEYIAKSLQAAHRGRPTEDERNLRITSLEAALKYFNVQFGTVSLHSIFAVQDEKTKTSDKSARGLRNLLVHTLSPVSIRELSRRGRSLVRAMQSFINAVEKAAL